MSYQLIWDAFAAGNYIRVFELIENLEEDDIEGQIEKAYFLSYVAEVEKAITLCDKLEEKTDEPVQLFSIQVIKSIATLWNDNYTEFLKLKKECIETYQDLSPNQQQKALRYYFTLQGIDAIAKLENREILDAERIFLKIIDHHESTNQVSPPWELNTILGYLGTINTLKGNFDQAEEWFTRRIAHSKTHNNKIQTARSNQQMATLYWKTDRIDQAINLYQNSKAIIIDQMKILDLNWLNQYLNEINYNLVLIFLEKNEINKAKELFEKLQSQSKGFKRNVDRIRVQILEALILLTDNRAKSIVKAYTILDQLSNKRIDDPNVFIFILLQKYQILLWEFEATENVKIKDELESLYKDMVELSTQLKSDYLTVELNLLEIQWLLLKEDFSDAVKLLEKCEELTKQNHYNGLHRQLKEIEFTIQDDISRLESISNQTKLVERIHQSKIKEYIKTAIKSVSTMQKGR